MTSKLLNAKTEESRSNLILNFIFIYIIAIVYKCNSAYARSYTLIIVTKGINYIGITTIKYKMIAP